MTAYRSLKKEKEENLPLESSFPLHLVGNQLNVVPSIKAENGAYEHKQLNSVEVESHSSEGDISENDYEYEHFLNQIAISINTDFQICCWERVGELVNRIKFIT